MCRRIKIDVKKSALTGAAIAGVMTIMAMASPSLIPVAAVLMRPLTILGRRTVIGTVIGKAIKIGTEWYGSSTDGSSTDDDSTDDDDRGDQLGLGWWAFIVAVSPESDDFRCRLWASSTGSRRHSYNRLPSTGCGKCRRCGTSRT